MVIESLSSRASDRARCAMLLSDMGADVLRIDRTSAAGTGISMRAKFDLLNRGAFGGVRSQKPEAIEAVMRSSKRPTHSSRDFGLA